MLRQPPTILLAAILALAAPAAASPPPPPPPAYIVALARLIAPDRTDANFAAYAPSLAPDLTVTVDGRLVAASRAAWVAQERARLGRVDRRLLAVTEGQDALLVIDRYDDRSDVPGASGIVADPRPAIRAARYEVGADHLVHAIRIVQVAGIAQAVP